MLLESGKIYLRRITMNRKLDGAIFGVLQVWILHFWILAAPCGGQQRNRNPNHWSRPARQRAACNQSVFPFCRASSGGRGAPCRSRSTFPFLSCCPRHVLHSEIRATPSAGNLTNDQIFRAG